MQDTAYLIALILIIAFAVERVTVGADFLLGAQNAADDARGRRRRRLLLFALSAALTLAAVDYGQIRILARLQPGVAPLLDYWITWVVVLAGADRVKELLGTASGGATKEPKREIPPIKIVVDDGVSARVA